MPIYEYRRPDGTTFEVHQAFSEDTLTEDPDTGVPVERVLHAPAVHFKGKGFYNTDYGTRKRQRETAASGESSSAGDSSVGDSSGSDSSKNGGSDSSSKSDSATTTESKKGESSAKPTAKSDASNGGGQTGKQVAAAK